jgi:hypothetical protein
MVKPPWNLAIQIEVSAGLQRMRDLRRWQREFYRTRTRQSLHRCKQLERDVDSWLDSVENNLFDLKMGAELEAQHCQSNQNHLM